MVNVYPVTHRWFKLVIALVLVFSLATSMTHASDTEAGAEQSVPELTAESATQFLEDFFTAEHVQPHYVGAAVTIVKDGDVVAAEGYGFADAASEQPVDPASTVFRVASVSKSFTAAAVMQLIEQGKIDLEEDFITYLDGMTYENPYDTPVTIEHLLTHTTGFEIRDPQQTDIHTDLDKYVAIEDYVRSHMPPVIREPGSSYMYDNFASLLLGLIVQEVSGMPYEDYMEQNVFEPLDMQNSGFLLEGALKDQLATAYDPARQPMELYTVTPTVMPHGGMLTTAEDVGKFMLAFLDGASVGEGRILTASSVEMMQSYRSEIHPLLPDTTYGFEAAFQLPGAGSSPSIITKAGDLNGFSSYLMFIPEQKLGVFITGNQMGALRNLFYNQFMGTFYPEYAQPITPKEGFTPASAEELAAYEGLYTDLRLKMLVTNVQAAGPGQLSISDALIGPRVLTQVGDGLFTDQLSGQLTAFKQDEGGQTVYMKEPYLNPLGYAIKGEVPVGFTDIGEGHAYVESIHALQSIGHYDNASIVAFEPLKEVSRAEFVKNLLVVSSIKGSATQELAFTDIADHPNAPYIQMAAEIGLVSGYGDGTFSPEKAVTREEVAVMVWNALKLQYPQELFADVQVTGEISEWAMPAAQMLVKLGLHGPELETDPDASVDYKAKQALTRQEEAALFYKLLTQPTDQIVAQLQAS